MNNPDVELIRLDITTGTTWSDGWNLIDAAGQPLTQDDGWTGRAELRTDYGDGTPVLTFAAAGTAGAQGTVAFDDEGNVTLSVPAAATADLTATDNDRPLVGSLTIWQTTTPTQRWPAARFRLFIHPGDATT